MTHNPDRRTALLGLAVAAGTAAFGSTSANAAQSPGASVPEGAATLKALHEKLNAATRRRDFKTVPMILECEKLPGTGRRRCTGQQFHSRITAPRRGFPRLP